MDAPRVLMVGPSTSSTGGMAAVATCYLRHWDARRYQVRFVSSWASDRRSIAARVLLALQAWWQCGVAFVAWRPTVVHIHFAHKGSFYRKAVVLLLARLCRIETVILHAHAGPFPEFYQRSGPMARALIRRIIGAADLLIVVAKPWETYFQGLVPGVPIVVLHNPVECPAAPTPMDARRPVVLTLGVLAREKGTFDVLEAVPTVLAAAPAAEFWLAGDGDSAAVSARLEKASWGGKVTLLGWVEGSRKEACLEAASVFLLPSYAEGLPMAMLEAMAYGVAVVATPVGGIPDALIDGETGVLVEPGDVAGLAAITARLLNDEGLRARLGDAARRYAREHFAIERVLDQLYGAYDRVLAGTRPARPTKTWS